MRRRAPAVVIVASGAGTAIGMAVGGIVAVVVLSAVFYAIGRGEDRSRAAAPDDVVNAAPEQRRGADAGATDDPGDRDAPEPNAVPPCVPEHLKGAPRRRRP
jgi:hypothetical protein